jgi:hypothetical protein
MSHKISGTTAVPSRSIHMRTNILQNLILIEPSTCCKRTNNNNGVILGIFLKQTSKVYIYTVNINDNILSPSDENSFHIGDILYRDVQYGCEHRQN